MNKNEVISIGMRYTKWMLPDRYAMLYDRAFEARLLDGVMVECGTALGGSAAVFAGAAMRSLPPGKEIPYLYCFDTFEGLPLPTKKDGPKAVGMEGHCAGPVESVTAAMKEIGRSPDSWLPVKGLYADTLQLYAPVIDKISLLHLDGDWYESTKIALEAFAHKVVKGGFIIVDDYGFWEGCKLACEEWFAKHGRPKLHEIPNSPQRWWQV